MVYGLVDEAGTEGIWSKTIKTRSGLHDTAMRAAIKALETKRYITDMKSVEHLNRKMYIKSNLTPNEKATGGPWYTDGELDEAFIDSIQKVLYGFIFAKSFYKSSNIGATKRPKRTTKANADKATAAKSGEEVRALRDAALDPKNKSENDTERSAKKQKIAKEPDKGKEMDRYLPLPAGYQGYPTLKELTFHVENSNVTETTLTKEEISQLLDVLCFDGKIEKVVAGPDGLAYRALRQSAREIEEGVSNGLTEAPCGRCPVFDLCEEGGPVSPSNCEYFRSWLEN
jgi:DNA-directed RNA polymerase III subunit RPC6